MEESKTTTHPAWVDEMHKWQKENPKARAVLCVATDGGESFNTLYGKTLLLASALCAVMLDDSSWVDVCKGALIAKENPIAALALASVLEKSEKGETLNEEDEDKPTDSSIKDSLKTILSKLADKL